MRSIESILKKQRPFLTITELKPLRILFQPEFFIDPSHYLVHFSWQWRSRMIVHVTDSLPHSAILVHRSKSSDICVVTVLARMALSVSVITRQIRPAPLGLSA